MSLAGRPKTIAAKKRADAVAQARTAYRQKTDPIQNAWVKILAEQIRPHKDELKTQIRKADIAYFEAIGDTESVRLLEEAA